MRTLGEWLFLRPGELTRAWPFFGLYLLLFGAFTVADGLSLALFVEQVGAAQLPRYYAVTAAANLLLMGVYVLVAERVGGSRMFQAILAGALTVYAAGWAALRFADGGHAWLGALFVTREVAFTLVLMHFGTYLQDYFTRDEMDRVLPVVYAGGRVGGIGGGALLQWLSAPLGPLNLVPVFLGLGGVCLLLLSALSRRACPVRAPEDERGNARVAGPGAEELEGRARSSLGGFLRFAWASRLLLWASVSSVLFMAVRWLLNFQYSAFFEAHFGDSAALAAFLGRYTMAALLLSLLVQLFVVNRLVARVGVGGAYLGYSALVFSGALLCLPPMTLAVAVVVRLVETELRLGLRNPLMQLITNRFSKALRLRVRAWTMGVLTPVGTAASAALLAALAGGAVRWAGVGVGLAFLLSAVGVYASFRGASAGVGAAAPRGDDLAAGRAPRGARPAAK